MQPMCRLALEIINIHRIDHTRIWKQEEQQCAPGTRTWWIMRRKEVSNCNPWLTRISILLFDTNMVASPSSPSSIRPGARTGVSCGPTRSKKWQILGKVSLCKNWRKRANNASGRCLQLRTLISSMRWSRSASARTGRRPWGDEGLRSRCVPGP